MPVVDFADIRLLAPLGILICCAGVTGTCIVFWCTEPGLVDIDDIRLCLFPFLLVESDWGIPFPVVVGTGGGGIIADEEDAAGPWPISSAGSDTGMRIERFVYAEAPP
jgi:hypothetical protein